MHKTVSIIASIIGAVALLVGVCVFAVTWTPEHITTITIVIVLLAALLGPCPMIAAAWARRWTAQDRAREHYIRRAPQASAPMQHRRGHLRVVADRED